MAKKSTFSLGGILDDADATLEPAPQRGSEEAEKLKSFVGQGPSNGYPLSLMLEPMMHFADAHLRKIRRIKLSANKL